MDNTIIEDKVNNTNTINSSKIDISTITSLFQELIVHLQVVAQEVPPSERQKLRFKTFSFQKAIKSLQNIDEDFITAESLESLTIPSVGKGIKNRISEIIETGSLQELADNTNETEKDTKNTTETDTTNSNKNSVEVGKDERSEIKNLLRITGVGPASAKKMINSGITIERLGMVRENIKNEGVDWKKDTPYTEWNNLTHHQKIGMFYFEDFEKRIPKAEIERFEKLLYPIITRLNKQIQWEICGSYRRGQSNSGDIDILITHPEYNTRDKVTENPWLQTLVNTLESKNILCDHLTNEGKSKYMGVGRVPIQGQPDWMDTSIARRIDIRFVPYDSYITSLLYFTGSAKENIRLRKVAISKGYKLSEYGLFDSDGDAIVFKTEQEAYQFLGLEYVEPTSR